MDFECLRPYVGNVTTDVTFEATGLAAGEGDYYVFSANNATTTA